MSIAEQFEEEEYDVDNKEDERLSDMNTETDKESETELSLFSASLHDARKTNGAKNKKELSIC